MTKKRPSGFAYQKPKAFYEEGGGPFGAGRYFVEGFGGKKQYFNSETEYDNFVKLDRENKYKKFQKDISDMLSLGSNRPRRSKRPMYASNFFGMR